MIKKTYYGENTATKSYDDPQGGCLCEIEAFVPWLKAMPPPHMMKNERNITEKDRFPISYAQWMDAELVKSTDTHKLCWRTFLNRTDVERIFFFLYQIRSPPKRDTI